MDAPIATEYDPLRDTEPELARTMADSVTQHNIPPLRALQRGRKIEREPCNSRSPVLDFRQ